MRSFEKYQKLLGDHIVSRETIERLSLYEKEIIRWNSKINLIAATTIPSLWERHFVDSLQILPLIPDNCRTWADLGSGGGFPGLVLAAARSDIHFTLVESDQRKCMFLRKMARDMGVDVEICPERVEKANLNRPDIISARALADLDQLLFWSFPHAKPDTRFIFLKGKKWNNELTIAEKNWQMSVVERPSCTDSQSRILMIEKVSKK